MKDIKPNRSHHWYEYEHLYLYVYLYQWFWRYCKPTFNERDQVRRSNLVSISVAALEISALDPYNEKIGIKAGPLFSVYGSFQGHVRLLTSITAPIWAVSDLRDWHLYGICTTYAFWFASDVTCSRDNTYILLEYSSLTYFLTVKWNSEEDTVRARSLIVVVVAAHVFVCYWYKPCKSTEKSNVFSKEEN